MPDGRPAVDLNADLGEVPGADEALLRIVTTAHIACGYHAGDITTMRRTSAAALEAGVTIGAHPSYPDRAGFGRRPMQRSVAQVIDDVEVQIATLAAAAGDVGGTVRSVKPHGALYTTVSSDPALAEALAGALMAMGGHLVLVLAAGSPGLSAAAATGVPTAAEGFADRRYRGDGTLVDRADPGALVTDPVAAAARSVCLVTKNTIDTSDAGPITLRCDTICVHGDTPGALVIATAVRRELGISGVEVRSFIR